MNKQRKEDLQCILTSLYYLSEEATRRNLPEVSTMLVSSINGVAAWIDDGTLNNQTSNSSSLIDESLYHAMHFLHNLAKLSKGRPADFQKVFESITMQFHQQYQIILKPDGNECMTVNSNLRGRTPRRVRH